MKFAPYSFSKQNCFGSCPKKFEFNYIKKIRTPFKMNATLEKGSYVHLLLENLAMGKLHETTYEFKHSTPEQKEEYKGVFKDFITSDVGKMYLDKENFFGAEVEFGVKVNEDGTWASTSYYNKKALFRGKIDHANKNGSVMELLDWKTGKINAFPAPLQLVMYAVWCFLEFPEVEEVRTAFVYVEHGVEKPYIFKRSHKEALEKKILEKLMEIEHAKEFPKKESKLCDYCEYRKDGLCDPETASEFTDNMMKYAPKKKVKKENDIETLLDEELPQTVWYYMHPESGCAWKQDFPDPMEDGLTQEVEPDLFYSLDDLGYDVDHTLHTKENNDV